MNAPASSTSQIVCTLMVSNGSNKGTQFKILSQMATIGRGPDNDIVIGDDNQCSRKQASITQTAQGYSLSNISEGNPIYINGKETSSAILKDGDTLQVGSTLMKVALQKNLDQSLSLAHPKTQTKIRIANSNAINTADSNFTKSGIVVPQTPVNFPVAGPSTPAIKQGQPNIANPRQNVRPMPPRKNGTKGYNYKSARKESWFSGRTRFYVILLAVGIVLGWFLLSGTKKKTNEFELRTSEKIAEEINNSNQQIEALEKQQQERGLNSPQYKNAQSYFIKGFRDYQNGQFYRAIQSFQAALAIFPSHKLAQRYVILAQRRFDEEVHANMVQGKRYRERSNFQFCRAAFANVMTMLKDPNNPIFREAKQLYDECDFKMQGRY